MRSRYNMQLLKLYGIVWSATKPCGSWGMPSTTSSTAGSGGKLSARKQQLLTPLDICDHPPPTPSPDSGGAQRPPASASMGNKPVDGPFEPGPSYEIAQSPGGTPAWISLRHGIRLTSEGELATPSGSSFGSRFGGSGSNSARSTDSGSSLDGGFGLSLGDADDHVSMAEDGLIKQPLSSTNCSEHAATCMLSGATTTRHLSTASQQHGPRTRVRCRDNGDVDADKDELTMEERETETTHCRSTSFGGAKRFRMTEIKRERPRKLLGQGTFGDVEYATHLPTGAPMALKFMSFADTSHRGSIIRELQSYLLRSVSI